MPEFDPTNPEAIIRSLTPAQSRQLRQAITHTQCHPETGEGLAKHSPTGPSPSRRDFMADACKIAHLGGFEILNTLIMRSGKYTNDGPHPQTGTYSSAEDQAYAVTIRLTPAGLRAACLLYQRQGKDRPDLLPAYAREVYDAVDERTRYSIVEDTDVDDFRYDPNERFSAMAHIGEDGEPSGPTLGGFATRDEAEAAVRESGGVVKE